MTYDKKLGVSSEDEEIIRLCAKSIESSVSTILHTVEQVRNTVLEIWRNKPNLQKQGVSKKDLATLQTSVKKLISVAEVHINGAGFVVAPDILSDARLYLEWWRQGAKPGNFIPLKVNLDEHSDTFYDYPNMPWFYKPRDEEAGHVIGPYVDMLGVDMYICTFSLPVYYSDVFLGIAGADVPLNNLEPVVIPHLMRLHKPAVLANDDFRVISSNTSRWLVGDFLMSFQLSRSSNSQMISLDHSVENWRLVVFEE
ncbi:cache domain-containing protein [Litchfieldella rifensis]|uniref:Cache domain-containing protein n=1 Tax=Litchfieldella rifensis TaxID=762643 RepID=A0ABV7LWD2_9GAMM